MNNLLNKIKEVFSDQEVRSKLVEENKFADFLLLIGTNISFFLFSVVVFSSILFIFKLPITSLSLIISSLIALIFCYISTKKFFRKNTLIISLDIACTIFLVFLFSIFLSSIFLDLSYDGQSYHQEAIIQLNNGWDPFYTQLSKEQVPLEDRWVNFYPKSSWIIESSLSKITNNIESTKALNFVLYAMSFFFVLSFLLRIKDLNKFIAVFISFVAVSNPVWLHESLSFYVDGQLSELLLSLCSILLMFYFNKKIFFLLPFLFLSVVLINIKFTALVYTAFFTIFLLIFLYIEDREKQALKVIFTSIAIFLIGFLFVGFNPYVTNTINKGHPFFPAAGKGAYDFVSTNIPGNYESKSPIERLILSNFSKTENLRGGDTMASLKIPFTIDDKEKEALTHTDNTSGGFDPFFGGALILTFLIFLFDFIKKENRTTIKYTVSIILIIIFSCVINAASSYARFVPQLWLIPVIGLLYSLRFQKDIKIKLLGLLLMITLSVNIFFTAKEYFTYNLKTTNLINDKISFLKETTKNNSMYIYFGEYRSNRIRLTNAKINFNEILDKDKCKELKPLFNDGVVNECILK